MEIFIEKKKESLELEHKGSAGTLLAKLDINPETVLIVKDGVLVTQEDDVSDAKKIELLSVISGG